MTVVKLKRQFLGGSGVLGSSNFLLCGVCSLGEFSVSVVDFFISFEGGTTDSFGFADIGLSFFGTS